MIIVAKDGSGSYSSIQSGLNAANPGDIIAVKSGTYNERLIFPKSGNEGNYIALSAYSGHSPIIDGTNVSIDGDNRAGLVQISQKNWIKVIGFKITNSPKSGIRMYGVQNVIIQSNNIDAEQCSILNGYDTQSRNVLINNNICDRNYTSLDCLTTNGSIQEVISMDFVDNLEVSYNQVLRNTCGEGIDVKNGCTNAKVHHNTVQNTDVGIYADGMSRDTHHIDIYSNITKYNRISGIKLADEGNGKLRFVNVYNNLSYKNNYAGIILEASVFGDINASIIEDVEIYHNTVYNNGYGTYPSGGIIVGTWRDNNSKRWNRINIFRNIVSNNNKFQIAAANENPYVQNVVIDQNFIQGFRSCTPCYTSSGEWAIWETKGTNFKEGDPLFIDSTGENFKLQSSSPAIGYGYDELANVCSSWICEENNTGYETNSCGERRYAERCKTISTEEELDNTNTKYALLTLGSIGLLYLLKRYKNNKENYK